MNNKQPATTVTRAENKRQERFSEYSLIAIHRVSFEETRSARLNSVELKYTTASFKLGKG